MNNFTEKKKVNFAYVYIIECGGLFKVGMSENPKKRIQNMLTSLPFKVDIVECIRFRSAYFARLAEKEIHLSLKNLSLHLSGEWFTEIDYFSIEKCRLNLSGVTQNIFDHSPINRKDSVELKAGSWK
jgi:hypothetical protein